MISYCDHFHYKKGALDTRGTLFYLVLYCHHSRFIIDYNPEKERRNKENGKGNGCSDSISFLLPTIKEEINK